MGGYSMKRIIRVLLAVMTLISVASAEAWCSITDTLEQAPARWTNPCFLLMSAATPRDGYNSTPAMRNM